MLLYYACGFLLSFEQLLIFCIHLSLYCTWFRLRCASCFQTLGSFISRLGTSPFKYASCVSARMYIWARKKRYLCVVVTGCVVLNLYSCISDDLVWGQMLLQVWWWLSQQANKYIFENCSCPQCYPDECSFHQFWGYWSYAPICVYLVPDLG